jgi:hypothetical protein
MDTSSLPTQHDADTAPRIFSTDATTATMSMDALPTLPGLVPATPSEGAARERGMLAVAIAHHDVSTIVVSCLDLARALVDGHRLAAAIDELEACIALLRQRFDGTPLWRLQLTLAALYDGVGDRARARIAARDAREDARMCMSATGCERADLLLARLARRRSSTRRPRPW